MNFTNDRSSLYVGVVPYRPWPDRTAQVWPDQDFETLKLRVIVEQSSARYREDAPSRI